MASNPGFLGTDLFSGPRDPVTDSQIRGHEERTRGPAINAILQGGLAKPRQFGFRPLTMRQLQSLRDEELQALNTTLGTQFNETLENVIRRASLGMSRPGFSPVAMFSQGFI